MGRMVHGFSTPDLVRIIEENAIDFVRDWKRWPEMRFYEDPEMIRIESDIRFPIFNSVLRTRVSPERVDRTVRGVIDRAQSLNVPLIWWIGPSSEPAGLGSRLGEMGFNSMGRATGMAMDLDTLEVVEVEDESIQITPVLNHEDLRFSCDIVSAVNDFPDFAAEKWYEMNAALGYASPSRWRTYLARVNGKPAATATLYLGKDVASIVSVATLPEARRMGIGTAVSVRPFLDAREDGIRIGTLCSSEMGKGVYRNIGFSEYCSFEIYLWM